MKPHRPKYFLAVTLVWLCVSPAVFSQPPTPTPTPPSEEVIALRAQLETMRQYDERLLSTVYYSLGATGAVVAIVITLGWLTNFRIYRRDVEDVKREIKDDVEKFKTSLAQTMDTAARAAGERAVSSALHDIRKIQYKLLEFEVDSWIKKGVLRNALDVYPEMLNLSMAAQNEYWTRDILDGILRILRNREYQTLDSVVTSKLTESLNKLPPAFKIDVDSIFELLKQKRVTPSTS